MGEFKKIIAVLLAVIIYFAVFYGVLMPRTQHGPEIVHGLVYYVLFAFGLLLAMGTVELTGMTPFALPVLMIAFYIVQWSVTLHEKAVLSVVGPTCRWTCRMGESPARPVQAGMRSRV